MALGIGLRLKSGSTGEDEGLPPPEPGDSGTPIGLLLVLTYP